MSFSQGQGILLKNARNKVRTIVVVPDWFVRCRTPSQSLRPSMSALDPEARPLESYSDTTETPPQRIQSS